MDEPVDAMGVFKLVDVRKLMDVFGDVMDVLKLMDVLVDDMDVLVDDKDVPVDDTDVLKHVDVAQTTAA